MLRHFEKNKNVFADTTGGVLSLFSKKIKGKLFFAKKVRNKDVEQRLHFFLGTKKEEQMLKNKANNQMFPRNQLFQNIMYEPKLVVLINNKN